MIKVSKPRIPDTNIWTGHGDQLQRTQRTHIEVTVYILFPRRIRHVKVLVTRNKIRNIYKFELISYELNILILPVNAERWPETRTWLLFSYKVSVDENILLIDCYMYRLLSQKSTRRHVLSKKGASQKKSMMRYFSSFVESLPHIPSSGRALPPRL